MIFTKTITFKALIFIVTSAIVTIGALSWSIYKVSYDEIKASVEHRLILGGEFIAKDFRNSQKSLQSYQKDLARLAKEVGGYAFIIDNRKNLMVASSLEVRKNWEKILSLATLTNQPHPYKHEIEFMRFIVKYDPILKSKSYGILYKLSNEYTLGIAIAYERAFAPLSHIMTNILITVVVTTIVLAFLAYFVLKHLIVNPIVDISKQLQSTKKSTTLFQKVVTNQEGEIGELVTALNGRTELIQTLYHEIEDTQKEIIFTMGAIGESRSKETANHVKRVAHYSEILALGYGMSQKEAKLLKEASPMHDIGKVGIPDAVLKKPGRLNDEEMEIMKQHTTLGYEMLRHSKRELLQAAAIVAYQHHEKWDGSGYPRGLSGEDIHIYGRITAVADVFDALGSNRVYKKAWEDEKIFEIFRKERGKHFDPKLVDIFFKKLPEILKVRETFKDL